MEIDVNITHGDNNISVKEYKAPTDESIKLLHEFQQKALNSIISNLKTVDNIFNCNAVMNLNLMLFEYIIHVKYSFNKHERIVKYSFQQNERDLSKIVNGLKTAIAEDIAQVIVNSVLFDINNELLKMKYGV